MQNFDKKVKYLDSLFIYKFKIYDYEFHKVKIYYISADDQHIYFSIDSIPGRDQVYNCQIGDLFLDDVKRKTFEDTPNESFNITAAQFKYFKKYFEHIPNLSAIKIREIIESEGQKDLVV